MIIHRTLESRISKDSRPVSVGGGLVVLRSIETVLTASATCLGNPVRFNLWVLAVVFKSVWYSQVVRPEYVSLNAFLSGRAVDTTPRSRHCGGYTVGRLSDYLRGKDRCLQIPDEAAVRGKLLECLQR